jgi:hypothetical protein
MVPQSAGTVSQLSGRIPMHETLKEEIEIYEKRTPRSREAHQRAMARLPLGVGSNFRIYDPYPLFIRGEPS